MKRGIGKPNSNSSFHADALGKGTNLSLQSLVVVSLEKDDKKPLHYPKKLWQFPDNEEKKSVESQDWFKKNKAVVIIGNTTLLSMRTKMKLFLSVHLLFKAPLTI